MNNQGWSLLEVLLRDKQMIHLWFIKDDSSVQFNRSVMSNSLQPHEPQHARPPCPTQTPEVYSNSCPSSRWCHPAISSSDVPFSSCPQSLPASGSFQMSQLFTWGGQSIGVSASASVLPMNTQGWSPSGWTGWISLKSKGLSRVFSTLLGIIINRDHFHSQTCLTVGDMYFPYIVPIIFLGVPSYNWGPFFHLCSLFH